MRPGDLPQIPPAIATPRAFMHAVTRGRLSGKPRHLALLDELLVRAACEKVRAVVSLPVRMGKSELISVHAPPWYIGTFPDRRFMLGSHTAELANGFGGRARELLESHGPGSWGVEVDRASRAKGRWDVHGHSGGMFAAGVGGGFTGRGADLLVIDDPLKNREQAFSPEQRETQHEWLKSTALTRLEPGGSVLLVMARWHDDDLGGRMVREGWEEIRIPALCEDPETDPLGRGMEPCPICEATGENLPGNAYGQAEGAACFYCEGSGVIGEPLWPARMGHAELAQRRLDSGTYWWLALYQQRPPKEVGAVFRADHFRYWRDGGLAYILGDPEHGGRVVPKHRCVRLTYVDLAASAKQRADWTVFLTVALTPARELILLDVTRRHAEGSDKLALMGQVRERMNPAAFKVEKATYGLDLIADARRKGFAVGSVDPDADKVARAISAAVMYEAGRIWHPQEAPWLAAYESELLEFDSGQHDDQVDTIAYAARDAAASRPARTSAPKGALPSAGRGKMARRLGGGR